MTPSAAQQSSTANALRFRSLVLDVDSTLSAIEGIDWLAERRMEPVREVVEQITAGAMRGEIALGAVYSQRLELIMPTRTDIDELARAYVSRIEKGAPESLALLTRRGVRIILVTAGIRDAILPLACELGLAECDVHAVPVYFTDTGDYAGFDTASPLTQNGGKAIVVRGLDLKRPILGVGDGITDLELKTLEPPAVDAFVAYAGVVERPVVTAAADYIIHRFEQLPGIALA
jgi:phosphoserine phosphatase